MITITHHSMIRAAEVWTPDEDGSFQPASKLLRDPHDHLAAEVVERVASAPTPWVFQLRDGHLEEDSVSLNAEAGSAVLGMPIVAAGEVRAVLVLFLECLENSLGAVEIWTRDRRDELLVNGAVYANLGRFATISRFVRFPRSSGLPGKCWEQRNVLCLEGLGQSPDFMRAAGARAGGLAVGVALPIMATEFDLHSVVLLLSSRRSPIARVFEVWELDDDEQKLARQTCVGGDMLPSSQTPDEAWLPVDSGLVGQVFRTGIPLVTDSVAAIEPQRAALYEESGLTTAIAIPVWVGAGVQSVFVMLS